MEPGEGPWPSVSQGSISLSGQGDSVEENCLDEQVLKELQSLGGDDQGKHTTAIEEAVKQGDPLALRRVAHSLKGSSGNVGRGTIPSRHFDQTGENWGYRHSGWRGAASLPSPIGIGTDQACP